MVVALAALLCAAASGASGASAAVPLTWTPAVASDPGHALTLTCASAVLCVAVDDRGYVVSSTAPLSNAWSATPSIGPLARVAGVSCPSAAQCFAVDNGGDVYSGTRARRSWAWTPANIDAFTHLNAISCPSVSLCVAVDQSGNMLASTSPSNPMSWSLPMPVDGSHHITAVSCPTVWLCAAVDNAGNVLVSKIPASLLSWQATAVTSAGALNAVSCNRSALCVAVASNGSVYTTANLASGPVTWSATPVDPPGVLSAVSCTDVGLCVILDHGGKAFASDNPAAGRPRWAPSVIDRVHAGLTGVSCRSSGFCVAADDAGDTLVATLPAPTVTSGVGVASSQTEAQLGASVDPNDARLSDCHFDFGPTPAYGAQLPCTVVPTATGGSQAAVARVRGLNAATTYHFRIAASSGPGSAAGADAAFATPAPIAARPSLSGKPVVGALLSCQANLTSAAPATVSYAWLSDTAAIAGASTPSYLIASSDQTHHLSCQVTVSGDGATTSATSAFAAIPSQTPRAIVESSVGLATSLATFLRVRVTCSPQAAGSCTIELRLRATRIVHHERQRVTVGSSTSVLPVGATRTLSVSLNAIGRRLLKKRRRLAATLKVSGTIVGTLTATLQTDRLIFATRPKKHVPARVR